MVDILDESVVTLMEGIMDNLARDYKICWVLKTKYDAGWHFFANQYANRGIIKIFIPYDKDFNKVSNQNVRDMEDYLHKHFPNAREADYVSQTPDELRGKEYSRKRENGALTVKLPREVCIFTNGRRGTVNRNLADMEKYIRDCYLTTHSADYIIKKLREEAETDKKANKTARTLMGKGRSKKKAC